MVSGLLVPIIGAFFWRRGSNVAAFWAMVLGGGTTVVLESFGKSLPLGLDGNVYGITVSALIFVAFSYLFPDRVLAVEAESLPEEEAVSV